MLLIPRLTRISQEKDEERERERERERDSGGSSYLRKGVSFTKGIVMCRHSSTGSIGGDQSHSRIYRFVLRIRHSYFRVRDDTTKFFG